MRDMIVVYLSDGRNSQKLLQGLDVVCLSDGAAVERTYIDSNELKEVKDVKKSIKELSKEEQKMDFSPINV